MNQLLGNLSRISFQTPPVNDKTTGKITITEHRNVGAKFIVNIHQKNVVILL